MRHIGKHFFRGAKIGCFGWGAKSLCCALSVPQKPQQNAYFPGFGEEHINLFVRLKGLLSRGQPDPHQSKNFMFMCLPLFLVKREGKTLHPSRSRRCRENNPFTNKKKPLSFLLRTQICDFGNPLETPQTPKN